MSTRATPAILRMLLLLAAVILAGAAAAASAKRPTDPGRPDPVAPGEHVALDVLTYNVFLRPVLPDSQTTRTALMPDHLRGHDVLLLQEAYSNRHRERRLAERADDYSYPSPVLGRDRGLAQDGGVVILSRWPIEDERQRLFGKLCDRSDCLADKGILYARIEKQGQAFHVFATHLQSGRISRDTRERQMSVLRDWIDALDLPADEPVLIGGDFNTDLFSDPDTGAFTSMTRILGARHPEPPQGAEHEPTYDPPTNALAGGFRARYVDYVLYSDRHLAPVEATNAVRRVEAEGRPLSDHYAVRGRFVFENGAQTAPVAEVPETRQLTL